MEVTQTPDQACECSNYVARFVHAKWHQIRTCVLDSCLSQVALDYWRSFPPLRGRRNRNDKLSKATLPELP